MSLPTWHEEPIAKGHDRNGPARADPWILFGRAVGCGPRGRAGADDQARHDVPGFLLARIATDKSAAGQGLGGQLPVAVARRCLRLIAEGGGIIDAKNERAADWYASFDAERLRG